MTSTRRAFFASIAALAMPNAEAEQRRIAEEKRINDRYDRINATLDRMNANTEAWSREFAAKFITSPPRG